VGSGLSLLVLPLLLTAQAPHARKRVQMVEWLRRCYNPYLSSLLRLAMWVQRPIPLPSALVETTMEVVVAAAGARRRTVAGKGESTTTAEEVEVEEVEEVVPGQSWLVLGAAGSQRSKWQSQSK
jgi:hypothetical protein